MPQNWSSLVIHRLEIMKMRQVELVSVHVIPVSPVLDAAWCLQKARVLGRLLED